MFLTHVGSLLRNSGSTCPCGSLSFPRTPISCKVVVHRRAARYSMVRNKATVVHSKTCHVTSYHRDGEGGGTGDEGGGKTKGETGECFSWWLRGRKQSRFTGLVARRNKKHRARTVKTKPRAQGACTDPAGVSGRTGPMNEGSDASKTVAVFFRSHRRVPAPNTASAACSAIVGGGGALAASHSTCSRTETPMWTDIRMDQIDLK